MTRQPFLASPAINLIAAVCLSSLSATQAVAAQQAAADPKLPVGPSETAYVGYHQGVQAVQLCRDRVLDASEHVTIEALIDQRLEAPIGVGRKLALIEAAKDGIKARIAEDGCEAPDARAALERFDDLTQAK
ncbi:hypothetical protein BAL199_17148 [alpha proteobacterium BAL199]|jgi:hypothetical protein|nr:hypothetical protein BAL199_17148 [alpha proteobacterium BAL199]